MIFTAEQMAILEGDKGLSAEKLDDIYNPDGGSEHHVLRRKVWRQAVANEDTISGYWDWVVHQIALATSPQLEGTTEGGVQPASEEKPLTTDERVAFAVNHITINN